MSRRLLSFLAIWLLSGAIVVNAALEVADVTSARVGSEDTQEGATLLVAIGMHVALLLACLWIARVEGELRERGLDGWVSVLRTTQFVFIAGYLAIYLFVVLVGLGIGSVADSDAELEELLFGDAADGAELESAIWVIMTIVTGVAWTAALVSVPFFLVSLFAGRRPGARRATRPLEGVASGLGASAWAVVPIGAEAVAIVIDAIKLMAGGDVDPLTVASIALMPIAAIPAWRERLG
jgi:hypothetical protein